MCIYILSDLPNRLLQRDLSLEEQPACGKEARIYLDLHNRTSIAGFVKGGVLPYALGSCMFLLLGHICIYVCMF